MEKQGLVSELGQVEGNERVQNDSYGGNMPFSIENWTKEEQVNSRKELL